MKKILTLLTITGALTLPAQVVVDVLAPEELIGGRAHTWAAPAAEGWATPDMNLPENRVVADLVLASDGTAADSLACGVVTNGAELTGKVALIYRGTCNYSVKAKNAQDAGAIAVLVINNVPGAPVGMGAGSQGALVTIPAFQIGQADGAALRAAMDNGTTVTVLLGNKTGYYADDVGFTKFGVLLPKAMGYPSFLASAPGEFSMQVASWIRNFGMNVRLDAILNAVVVQGSDTLYNETSLINAVNPGDSVFVALPDFVQDSYSGRYTLTYNAFILGDQSLGDNSISLPFEFGSQYAVAPINAVTGIPVTTIGIQPATSTGEYENCLVFRDANASRAAVTGIHMYGAVNDPGDMQDELIFTRVHAWIDDFTGFSDPNFTITTLAEVYSQKNFLSDTGNFVTEFLPFTEAVVLEDNVRYLFCIATLNPAIFFGFNQNVHYETYDIVYDQPTAINRNGSSWFVGFVGGPVPTHSAEMIESSAIGILERNTSDIAPYPNPTSGLFQVPLKGHGATLITISDAAGRVLATHRTSSELYTLDLRGEAAGVYLVSIQSDKGRGVGRLVLE